MPLKRTPPTPATTDKSFAEKTSSAVAYPNDENVTHRRNRNASTNMSEFMREMRQLLSDYTEKSESKFLSLESSLTEIIAQNRELKESMSFISAQYDSIKNKLDAVEEQRKQDYTYISQLEDKLDAMERFLFSTKLEIKNVPKQEKETKECLMDIISKTAKVLHVPLEPREVKDIFRTKSKRENSTSTIVVDFMSTLKKENLVRCARKFNKDNSSNKLSSSHLSLPGPNRPVFVSEHLPPKGQRIFYLARKFAKENDFKYCWTTFGKTFLRKGEGDRHIRIDNEADLPKLCPGK